MRGSDRAREAAAGGICSARAALWTRGGRLGRTDWLGRAHCRGDGVVRFEREVGEGPDRWSPTAIETERERGAGLLAGNGPRPRSKGERGGRGAVGRPELGPREIEMRGLFDNFFNFVNSC